MLGQTVLSRSGTREFLTSEVFPDVAMLIVIEGIDNSDCASAIVELGEAHDNRVS